jgi:hypothetical protein
MGNSLTTINNPEKECGIVSRQFLAQKKDKSKFNQSSMALFTINLPPQMGALQSSLCSKF